MRGIMSSVRQVRKLLWIRQKEHVPYTFRCGMVTGRWERYRMEKGKEVFRNADKSQFFQLHTTVRHALLHSLECVVFAEMVVRLQFSFLERNKRKSIERSNYVKGSTCTWTLSMRCIVFCRRRYSALPSHKGNASHSS